MSKQPSSIKRSRTIGLVWRWALAVVLIFFSIFPVLWIVSASINPVNDLANQKLIPDNWSFDNFRQLVTNPIFPFFTWLKNSMIYFDNFHFTDPISDHAGSFCLFALPLQGSAKHA